MTWRSTRLAAVLYALVAIVLVVVVWQSAAHLTPSKGQPPNRVHLERGDAVIGPWLGWDANFYDRIANDGYPQSDRAVYDDAGETSVAFFPLYPAAARAVGEAAGDVGLGLWLVTVASGLLAALLVLRWATERLGVEAGWWTAGLVVLFPWAYVLIGAGYSESLFLALTVGAFLLAEHDRPAAAGVAAALAALTRAVGLGVVVGVALVVIERRGALRRDGWRLHLDAARIRRRDLAVSLGALGPLAWMSFGWWRYGNPIAYSTAQRGWSQGFGRRSLLKLGLWDQLLHDQDRGFVLMLVLQAIVIIAACTLVPSVIRRFGVGYGAYCIAVLGLPLLGSANFISNGRFVAVAFPVFAVVGERLAALPRRRAGTVLVLSFLALLTFSSYWGRGYLMG